MRAPSLLVLAVFGAFTSVAVAQTPTPEVPAPSEGPSAEPAPSDTTAEPISPASTESPRVETVQTVQPVPAVQDVPPPPAPVVAPTIVRVRAGDEEARGVVVVDARHVLTSASVVRDRARLRLVDESGSRPLEVVSVDDERGLALLRAESDVGVPATVGAVGVGERVHQGDATALVLLVREGALRTSEVCAVGAPLLNDRGELVAVCTSRTDATLADALTTLTEAPTGAPSPWRARVAIGFDYRVRRDFESTLGGELGFGVLGYDRFGLMIRSAFFQNARSDDESIRLRSAFELTAEVQIQHAFRIGPLPLRLGLGLGATYRPVRERRVEERLTLEPDCDPTLEPCRATFSVDRTDSDTDHRVLPSVRFGIAVGGIAFAYTAAIDTETPELTTHTLTIGTGL
ncbi:MAG: serine protease [Myxococcota bacterium]|jgi:hypothetical protein|nr:serine protease [Myxococcota bacterium]